MTIPSPVPLILEPRQDRSRQTAARLLDATERVMAEEGVDGVTVPKIAARAGTSVGIVYRRFRDKDALLRAVYERFFARSLAANVDALDPRRWAGHSTRAVVGAVVAGMVQGHHVHRRLLHALILYADLHQDVEFQRRIEEVNAAAVEQIVALLRPRRDDIGHDDLDRAVAFATMTVASALARWVHPAGERLFPVDGVDELSRELSRMVCAYLEVA